MKTKDLWMVNVKGEPNESFEISVVRTSNTHGRKSYGWFDENKIMISQNVYEGVSERVFNKLIELAMEECDLLNKEENGEQ